ncbi:MAG TPA: rhomboid family intramembrane serine protease [Thermoanaerobaculia bacterium]|nr:rhomboid family intramembrane serine protease [Thermoanaerobaculia bacterium]
MRRKAPVTMTLLVVIAIVFVFEMLLGGPRFGSNGNVLTGDVNGEVLESLGAIVSGMLVRHEFWRLVTAMFLHASFLHWAVNSWALYQLGTLYEVLFGSKRFAMTYFATGLVASLASAIRIGTTNGLSVGASGAIFGILGAFIFSVARSPVYRHQPWTRGLIGQLVFWIIVNIAIGYSLPFIDNVAHLGGLIAGLILGFIPHRVPPPPPRESVIDVGMMEEPRR